MKALSLTLLGILGLVGCKDNDLIVELPDGAIIKYVNCDGGTVIPDMTTKPPCAAAVGLPGKNLFCVDFSSSGSDSISALTNANWLFPACNPSNPANVRWTISAGKLQLDASNFTTFIGDCSFTVPVIKGNDIGSYKSFAFSVVHTVDVADGAASTVQAQMVQLYQDKILPSNLISSTTGRQKKMQWISVLAKTDLSPSYQPTTFRLLAPVAAGGNYSGWQIESIAIQGLP